jgi:glutamine cyclotransferase
MTLRAFKESSPSDPQTSRLQENIKQFIGQLNKSIFIDGNLVENVTVATTDTKIEHKLGRVPKGFIVTDLAANTNIWRISYDSRFITLRAGTSTSISFWVF